MYPVAQYPPQQYPPAGYPMAYQMQSEGSSAAPILIGLGLVAVIGVGGYFAYKQLSPQSASQSATQKQNSMTGQPSQTGQQPQAPQSNWPTETFRIASAVDSGLGVDVSGGSSDDGSKLILWDYHGGDNQHFSYNTTSKHILTSAGLAVTADNGGIVQKRPSGSNPDQRWEYDENTNEIKLEGSNTCLDASNSIRSGTDMLAYECNSGDNQKWNLETI